MMAWDKMENVSHSFLSKLCLFISKQPNKWKSLSPHKQFPVLSGTLESLLWLFSFFSLCLVPFVSLSEKCVWLSKVIGFGGVRCTLKGAADSKLYFSTELLGHYHGAWSEQCLLVLRGRQLESSLIGTIGTSMPQRGYNRVIDHLSGDQSIKWHWTLWPVSVGMEYVRGMFMECFCANVRLCHICHFKTIFCNLCSCITNLEAIMGGSTTEAQMGSSNGWEHQPDKTKEWL